MVKLTDYERTLLKEITEDDFYEQGVDSALWADCFIEFSSIPAREIRGVLSSLIKKDIINPIKYNIITFTENGKNVMRELGY